MSKLKKFFRVLACGLTVAVIVGGAYLTCEYWDTLVGNDKAQISPLPDDEDKPDVTLTHIVKFIVDGQETVKTVANGECLTDIPDPVKEGYIFKGWYIGETLIDLSNYAITENTTFYAVFEFDGIQVPENNFRTLTFIVDGEEFYSSTGINGKTFDNLPENPVKEGYTFIGWYIGDTKIDFSTYVVTVDVTFTAVFEEIPQEPTTFTVKFVVDGIETVQTIEEGAYPTLPEEPTKEGYTFQGWYMGDTLIEDVSTYPIIEDVTFTAVFEEIPQEPTIYTVKFVVDGVETIQTIEEGAYPTLPEEPTKEGYTFQGWYIGDTLIEDVSTYPITENTTFTAVFSEVIKFYEVKFIVDGTTVKSDMCIEGLAISFAPEDPVKEGYTFQGWYVDDTLVDLSTYIVTAPVTFTAVFEEIPQEEPINTTSASLFSFDGNTLTGYNGEETDIVIPKTYSIGEIKTETKEFLDFDALLDFMDNNNSLTIDLVDSNGASFEGITYSNIYDYISSISFPVVASFQMKTFIDGTDFTVTSIGRRAFFGCSSLTSITIPSTVRSIGNQAFFSCRSLTSITIPDSVTSIGMQAFSYCSGLTSITIPDSVTSIRYSAFAGCSGLISITIPDSVTSIGNRSFYGCTSLKTVNFTGTEAQWNAIEIGTDGNTPLTSATINYNYTEE